MRNKIILLILVFLISQSFVSAFLISDQGTNVREVATGNLTASANLTISIYDNLTGGNLNFEQNFSDAIVNGSWNVMVGPDLEYGKNLHSPLHHIPTELFYFQIEVKVSSHQVQNYPRLFSM